MAIKGDLWATTILLDALVALGLLQKKDEKYQNMPATEQYLVEGKRGAMTNMLVNTPAGAAYSVNEYIQWMTGVGLRDIRTDDILGRSKVFIEYK